MVVTHFRRGCGKRGREPGSERDGNWELRRLKPRYGEADTRNERGENWKVAGVHKNVTSKLELTGREVEVKKKNRIKGGGKREFSNTSF